MESKKGFLRTAIEKILNYIEDYQKDDKWMVIEICSAKFGVSKEEAIAVCEEFHFDRTINWNSFYLLMAHGDIVYECGMLELKDIERTCSNCAYYLVSDRGFMCNALHFQEVDPEGYCGDWTKR